MSDMAQLVNAGDIAARWKVSLATVHRLALRVVDPLPSHKIGGSRRFCPAEASRWLGLQTGEIRVELVDVEC